MGSYNIITKCDIFAKKLVTLDLDNVGLRRKDRLLEIGKQLYDIKRLYDNITKKECADLGARIMQQFENDIGDKYDCTAKECIENVCTVLRSLSYLGTTESDSDSELFNEGFRRVKTHVPREAHITLHEWAALGWTFEHLLKCALKDYEEKTQVNVIRHFETRDRLQVANDDNKRVHEELIAELSKEVPRPVKGKPVESLYFKRELLRRDV